jgi:delta 1-pyrroline-5-carboxylate dehydrogenase
MPIGELRKLPAPLEHSHRRSVVGSGGDGLSGFGRLAHGPFYDAEMTVTQQELAAKVVELVDEAREGGLSDEKIIEELAEAAQALEEELS